MQLREIIGNVLILAALVMTVHLSAVMVHRIRGVVLKSGYRELFVYELIGCALFLLLALDVRFGLFTCISYPAARAVGWFARVLLWGAFILFLFLFGKIWIAGRTCTAGDADHVIVLGLALENGKPTADLHARMDTAAAYLRTHPEADVILTGGNPDASGKTEAAVMQDLLLERGIAKNRMILEDQAETTGANFRNTARFIDPEKPVVPITNSYHMARAARRAEQSGFAGVLRLPAPSSWKCFFANMAAEVILELNERLRGT